MVPQEICEHRGHQNWAKYNPISNIILSPTLSLVRMAECINSKIKDVFVKLVCLVLCFFFQNFFLSPLNIFKYIVHVWFIHSYIFIFLSQSKHFRISGNNWYIDKWQNQRCFCEISSQFFQLLLDFGIYFIVF